MISLAPCPAQEAIKLFTLAVDMAASRPLWEMAALARDELAVCLCNRSAAFAAVGDWVDSYVDADAVVQLKRPWLKGHYRKGVALREMGRGEEAREALRVGLQFDPESPVSKMRCDAMRCDSGRRKRREADLIDSSFAFTLRRDRTCSRHSLRCRQVKEAITKRPKHSSVERWRISPNLATSLCNHR